MSQNLTKYVDDVSIVMAVKDGLDVTQSCLATLLPEKFKELIIVDNNSAADTKKYLERLQTKDRRVRVVFNTFNRGFADANNQGLSLATGKYVLFLNNDTLVTPKFISPLVSHLQHHPKTAAVQPIIVFPDKTIDSVGSYFTPTGFLYHKAHRQRMSYRNCNPSSVYSLKGACMLWQKEVLDQIGGFDSSYFAYFEETDLCHRAWNLGWRVEFVPKSIIIHYGGFTSNKLAPAFVQYHNTKNRILTYFRHLSWSDLISVMVWHWPLTLLQAMSSLLKNRSAGLAQVKGLLMGTVLGLVVKFKVPTKSVSLIQLTKKPSVDYYLALFNSLKNYQKIF